MAPRLPLLVLLSILACSVAGASDCRRGIHSADRIVTGLGVHSAAYGDFNEDGRVDVAVMMLYGNRIVALNRGPVFEPLKLESLQSAASSAAFEIPLIAASDFNRDGHLDLLYRKYNSVGLSPGRGDGTFKPLIWSTVPSDASSWRLVDFDHDGVLDFIDTDGRRGFTFIRARGDGSFVREGEAALSSGGLQLVKAGMGDFDGDGLFDVVLLATDGGTSKTTVMIGWNGGAYQFTTTTAQLDVPLHLLPADVNGDGAEELVGIANGSLIVLRMRNRKVVLESFPVLPDGTSSSGAREFVAIDANGDRIRDLVFSAGGAIGVVWGSEASGFQGASFYEVRGQGLALADVDSDGVIDFASAAGTDGLAVVNGRSLADGSPNASRAYPAGFTPAVLQFDDVDGDGNGDLIATSGQENVLQAAVHYGDGRGSFGRFSKLFRSPQYLNARAFVDDFDGDGFADLAITGSDSAIGPTIAFGRTDGFSAATLQVDSGTLLGRVWIDPSSPPALVAMTGDEIRLVTVSSGRLATTSSIARLGSGARPVVVQAERGLEPQLLIIDGVEIRMLARRDGTWKESLVGSSSSLRRVSGASSADFDRDGKPDLLIWESAIELFYAQPDGTYKSKGLVGFPYGPGFTDSVTVADFDRDGWPDIVQTTRGNFGDPGIAVVGHNAGGVFERYATTMTAAPFRNGVVVDDLNGDGWPDLAIPSFDGAEVLINECATPRVRAAIVPQNPLPGTAARIVVHELSTNAFGSGGVTVAMSGKSLGTQFPEGAFAMATAIFTTPPLAAGQHWFRVEYQDHYAGSSAIDLEVTAASTVRRRAVRR